MQKSSKRGRPKGSKKEIANLQFWMGILKDNKVQQFIDKGNVEQKGNIKNVLVYLKNMNPEFFEDINGKNLLNQLYSLEKKGK